VAPVTLRGLEGACVPAGLTTRLSAAIRTETGSPSPTDAALTASMRPTSDLEHALFNQRQLSQLQ